MCSWLWPTGLLTSATCTLLLLLSYTSSLTSDPSDTVSFSSSKDSFTSLSIFYISHFLPSYSFRVCSLGVSLFFPFSSFNPIPFSFFFRKIIPKIKWGIYRSRCQVLINFFKNPIVIRIRKHKKNHSIRYQVTR